MQGGLNQGVGRSSDTVPVWDNFDERMMAVMRTEARANHPTRFFVDRFLMERFGGRHFRWLEIGLVGMVDYERLVDRLSFTFTGVDVSRVIVQDSRRYLRRSEDRVLLWNVERPLEEAEQPLSLGSFDLVTIRHVLNHCTYYEEPLHTIHQLLAEGGLCVVTLHLCLVDGADQLRRSTEFPVPGEIIGNAYGKQRFLSFVNRHFQIERCVRFNDGHKPNDVLMIRKRHVGECVARPPTMEIRRPAGWWARRAGAKLPPGVRAPLKRLIGRKS